MGQAAALERCTPGSDRRKSVMAVLAGCTAVLLSANPALAADPTGRRMKLPESAADHLALAASYEEKVTAWRKEAADHRAMAEAYKKAHPADAATMEKHCMKIAKDAEKLATDAEDTANCAPRRCRGGDAPYCG
jgi:hypothetical protein